MRTSSEWSTQRSGSSETTRDRVTRLAPTLAKAAIFLEVLAWLYAIGGVIAGIAVATHTTIDSNDNTTHPFGALGIGIMVGAVVIGTVYWVGARAVRLFAEYCAFRTESPGGDVGDRQ